MDQSVLGLIHHSRQSNALAARYPVQNALSQRQCRPVAPANSTHAHPEPAARGYRYEGFPDSHPLVEYERAQSRAPHREP